MSILKSHTKPLRLTSCIAIALGLTFSVSCSTVSVDKSNTSKAIINKRGNIVTKNSLSNRTISVLVSTGLTAEECLNDINHCVDEINQSILNQNSKETLALFAELYLAKAKQIEESESCVQKILRPPIDPYYANAPLTSETKVQELIYLRQCNEEYRQNLLSAIKYSYSYLFYDQLTPELTPSSPKTNHLPNSLDIQTQDVYDVAANSLLLQLYSNRNHGQQVAKVTSFLQPEYANNAPNSITQDYSNANGKKYGEQIKLLNFTFPPIDEDTYFKEALTKEEYELFKDKVDTITRAESTNQDQDNSRDNSQDTSIDLYLPNEPEYLQNTPRFNHTIDKLYPSHQLSFSGLNTVSERDGFGISYVTLLDDQPNTSVKGLLTTDNKIVNSENPRDRINLTGNMLMTGVVIPQGDTLEAVLETHDFDINLYNPHHTKTIEILGSTYDLAANFSASYGMWLSENNLANVGYFNLLAKQQTLIMPQLYMLEPYDPNKRIIIMLHGLASSPATWVSVTNDIFNDSVLRDNYQVWQIFYPTNIPILENRFRIQELIETAYKMNDPNGEHIASHNSVLIGHSMGAVIGRLMVSNENLETRIDLNSKERQDLRLNNVLNKEFNELNIKNRLHLHKLDSVDTAIFISAPFKGTDFAERWFTRLLRQIVQLPAGFAQTLKGNLTSIATDGELTANPLGALYLQNGASQLSDQSSFMKLTADLKIAEGVTYHSIIANRDNDLFQGLQKLKLTTIPQTQLSDPLNTDSDKSSNKSSNKAINDGAEAGGVIKEDVEILKSISGGDDLSLGEIKQDISQSVTSKLSDGIVPYNSSHLEGAASETILSGGHGIHETPEAILTLRKILHQHLKEHPIENSE